MFIYLWVPECDIVLKISKCLNQLKFHSIFMYGVYTCQKIKKYLLIITYLIIIAYSINMYCINFTCNDDTNSFIVSSALTMLLMKYLINLVLFM